MVKPYYESGGVTIYHGRCEDVLPTIDPASVALVLADPPYGIGLETDYRQRKRGALALSNDYAPVVGDDRPFDPAPLLRFRRVVLFGANHYADRLPPSPSWLIWDKLDGLESRREVGFNDQADAELAWTNLGGPARLFGHRWVGMLKASEREQGRVHPTQKPVALMRWIVANWTAPGDLVLDPYMGSGPVAQAAKQLQRRYVGVEIVEDYCEIAARRLAQEVLPLEVIA